MLRKRVRMKDVAEAAGVSQTTASFVLNGRDASIPLETRQRVLTIAKQLEYRPHASARALATGRTHRLGIVLNTPDSFSTRDEYFGEVLSGVIDHALRFNYNLLLHTAHYPDWHDLHADILSGGSDGVLLVGRYVGDELTRALLESEFPTICVSYYIEHPACYWVDCENEAGACLATQHLLALGHRNIAFFYPGESISWGRERRIGASQAFADAGLSDTLLQCYSWMETDLPTIEWPLSAIEFLKTAEPRPTAVLCCDEARARKIVELLPLHGLRVPEDIAMVSFNSTETSARARPPMTSIYQPLREIGEAAVEMLVARIEGNELPLRCRRLPVRLDVRESSGVRRDMAVVRVPVQESKPKARKE